MVGNNFMGVQILFLTVNYLTVCLFGENSIDRDHWALFFGGYFYASFCAYVHVMCVKYCTVYLAVLFYGLKLAFLVLVAYQHFRI